MAENYREFNAGNNTEESEDKKTKKHQEITDGQVK